MKDISLASVVHKTSWGSDLMTLTLDHSPENFVAGQFFNLSLKLNGKAIRRSYSAASAPGAPLEFFVSLVPNGELTGSLFALEEGDSLEIDPKALGFFTLAEVPPAKTLWMVATGTGLGPYISMLRTSEVWQRHERIIVVHGARHPYQLAYGDELRQVCRSHSSLQYIPILSGVTPPSPPSDSTLSAKKQEIHSNVLQGRITHHWQDGTLEKTAGAPFDQDSHMLLCGNPQMIADMTSALKERGYEKHKRRKAGHFTFEKYW